MQVVVDMNKVRRWQDRIFAYPKHRIWFISKGLEIVNNLFALFDDV
jgi:hypothetical protein